MNHTVTVALAQLDLVVGDVDGNTARILEFSARARDELLADLVVFPELSICGYPPEDLLFHSGLRISVEKSLALIRESVRGIAVLVGFPEYEGDHTYNSCAVFSDGSPQPYSRSTGSESVSTSAKTSGSKRQSRPVEQQAPNVSLPSTARPTRSTVRAIGKVW
jgi:hypothetical protein